VTELVRVQNANAGNLVMEGATIIFRNFAGKEGKYNREGDRNFCVLLDVQTAQQMADDGWNIKTLKARDSSDPDQPYIQVSVGFKNRPPAVWLVTRKGKTAIDEEALDVLDWVDIASVDLTIRPYKWEVGDKSGIKAYLKTIFVIVDEDILVRKYEDLEELPSSSGRVVEGPIAIESGARMEYDFDAEVVE